MSVLYLEWDGDLQISQNGSLVMANGWDEARQLAERAILTNPLTTLPDGSTIPPDYIFDPAYGAGLGLWVGQNPTAHALREQTRIIRNAVLGLSSVDTNVAPSVTFKPFASGAGMLVLVAMKLKNSQTGVLTLQTGIA